VIGVIDSGVGGLSVLREIRDQLPDQDLIYIGDTAWCPYGNKSFPAICERTFTLTDFLMSRGAGVIVVACNSATIVAIQALRAHYPLPFIGMEPGVKPAAAMTRTGTIGVLATEASLSGQKFHHLVDQHARDLQVITQPCPRFVELVEKGILAGSEVDEAIETYTTEMLAANADVFILGCSHYPFLLPALKNKLPTHIRFIDTGEAIARRVSSHSLTPSTNPITEILTTGNRDQMKAMVEKLIPRFRFSCSFLSLP
jgi:glutamate racemase